MTGSTKRKISGLTGVELQLALQQLQQIRSSIMVEEVPESDPAPEDTFADELESMIATLEARQNDPSSLSFSYANVEALDRLNIRCVGDLRLQSNLTEAVAASSALGSDQLWSNEHMLNHLVFLHKSFANETATAARMFIDAFFFRATTMIPPPHKAAVVLDHAVPPVQLRANRGDTVSGIIDYTTFVAASDAKAYMRLYYPLSLRDPSGDKVVAFPTVEAKENAGRFEAHLPKVVLELAACAKQLQKSHIRGALTTGHKWLFIVVDINADGDGASYWISDVLEWRVNSKGTFEFSTEEGNPALIAGILGSWIQRSFQEFNGDEWFFKVPL
ncbi:hypothetical protein C8Q76DRAFT_794042 [Earliella scabrosa]|nr:hypothetical protein C8Q76DRAFT_794042 [Earliella scabrosa]